MIIREDFPYLRHFFACYFHEDWRIEYESEEMAIKGYVDDDGLEDANHVLQELGAFLSLGLPKTELERVMYDDLGCYHDPEPDGITMTEWLRGVRDTMAKYAAEKAAQEKSPQG